MLPAPSFRDPDGTCLRLADSIFRLVLPDPAQELESFLSSAPGRGLMEKGQLVGSRRLDDAAAGSVRERLVRSGHTLPDGAVTVFEHDRVFFPSYPHEWPAELLWAAGRLTLDAAATAADGGFGLKDATPSNVLFRGTKPVFVDVLSFERRDPRDPVWKPYGQFVRTFLLPLLAQREWNLSPAEIFTTRRDGLEPEAVYRLAGPLQRLQPRFLGLVSFPTWLGRRAGAREGSVYQERRAAEPEKAQFILRALLRSLRRKLDALEPRRRPASAWSGYMDSLKYQGGDFGAKERFVADALREFQPRRVLDVGSNTGHFSLLAARGGAEVVAIDLDPACAGLLWRQATSEGCNVLPLVVDLSRPSPALGWRNAECPSFLDRATGAFDGLLMLAVLHHLLVTERIPLDQAMGLAAELTTDVAMVEFVGPQDEMFRRIARGRDALHAGLDPLAFERACAPHFEIVRQTRLGESQRWLYLLRRRSVR